MGASPSGSGPTRLRLPEPRNRVSALRVTPPRARTPDQRRGSASPGEPGPAKTIATRTVARVLRRSWRTVISPSCDPERQRRCDRRHNQRGHFSSRNVHSPGMLCRVVGHAAAIAIDDEAFLILAVVLCNRASSTFPPFEDAAIPSWPFSTRNLTPWPSRFATTPFNRNFPLPQVGIPRARSAAKFPSPRRREC